jgi:hypothetical protein
MTKGYLYTKITPTRNIANYYDADEDLGDNEWRYKANRLQARRWRKIKHQLV